MTEPASGTFLGVAMTTAGSTVAVLTVAGVPTGLRPDQLLAGFLGAVAAMALLNSVPSTGDTWRELLRTSIERVSVAIGSAVTAGYVGPLVGLVSGIPGPLLLGITFVVGAAAQRVLRGLVDRTAEKVRNGRIPEETEIEGNSR